VELGTYSVSGSVAESQGSSEVSGSDAGSRRLLEAAGCDTKSDATSLGSDPDPYAGQGWREGCNGYGL